MVFFLKRHYKPHNNHSKHIQQNNSTKEGFVTRTDEDAALCCFGEKQKKKERFGMKIIPGSEKRHKETCWLKNEVCSTFDCSKFFMTKKKL